MLVALLLIARSFDATKTRMAAQLVSARSDAEQARDAAARSHASARRLLDNVEDGLFTVGPDGTVDDEVSAAAASWFGSPQRRETVWSWLGRTDAKASAALALGWAAHQEGILPPELTLDQMPGVLRSQCDGGERTIALAGSRPTSPARPSSSRPT